LKIAKIQHRGKHLLTDPNYITYNWRAHVVPLFSIFLENKSITLINLYVYNFFLCCIRQNVHCDNAKSDHIHTILNCVNYSVRVFFANIISNNQGDIIHFDNQYKSETLTATNTAKTENHIRNSIITNLLQLFDKSPCCPQSYAKPRIVLAEIL
jgi:hypothetical protein